jgi:hypothetical protein
MAGLYPDVPGRRFAYDTDGTLVRYKNPDGTFREINNAALMNDESATASITTDLVEMWRPGSNGANIQATGPNSLGFATFVFPQLRSIAGYYAMYWSQSVANTGQFRALQWSADTTDGSDGVWTEIAANFTGDFINSGGVPSGNPVPFYRQRITPLNLTNVKGIRFGMARDNTTFDSRDAHGFAVLHLYGEILSPTGGLMFWSPTLDQRLLGAALDFGDLAQGTMGVKTFRVKNTHPTLTANSVLVRAAANNLSNALMANGSTFSLDGTTYTANVTVPAIAPGAISPLIYMRRIVGATEAPTARTARVTATAASFS